MTSDFEVIKALELEECESETLLIGQNTNYFVLTYV